MQKSISSLNQGLISINRDKCVQSAKEPIVRSTSSSDIDESIRPATKEVSKWSKRIQFKRRLEMGNKNLIVLNFEGVIGDVFKDNIWQDQKEKLHTRKGAIKGLKDLINSFQVVLFFHTSRINPEKILQFFAKKFLTFDGVYVSENHEKWAQKYSNKFKKPLKYSENIQNYSQISIDFGLQHEVLGRMLIVTSICVDDDNFVPGTNLIVRNLNSIPSYLW